MDADRIKGRVEVGIGRAEEAYGHWAADDDLRLKGETRQEAGKAEALLGQAKDSLRDTVERVLGSTEGAYESGRRALEEGAGRLNAQVERNPAVAILIAATAGYLLAMLFRSRGG